MNKVLIFILTALIAAYSCRNSAEYQNSTDNMDSINFVIDTLPSPQIQGFKTIEKEGEYIFITKELLYDTLGSLKRDNKHAYLKMWKSNMIDYLSNNYKFLDLNINDIISLNKEYTVLSLDSLELINITRDPNLKNYEKNYLIINDFPNPEGSFTQTEKICWGVSATTNSIKSNITSSKKVWIIDTGIDKFHEDLNVDTNLSRSFVKGYNFWDVGGDGDMHGTHVAGIIGAKANGKGSVGIAPNSKLVAIKIFHNRICDYEKYLLALQYVLENANEGDVLNLSIEKTKGQQNEIEKLKAIAAKGVYVVIAAGNSNVDINTNRIYPAAVEGKNIFTVGSYEEDNWQGFQFSPFSNYGPPIVGCAPGNKIYSTLPYNKYGEMYGTSMSAPHVSGLLYLNGTIRLNSQVLCSNNNRQYSLVHE